MIQTNWHTHTKRCGHAEGEDEAYVQAAVKAGLKILGFSDHAPYPIPTPGDCMPIELYDDYVSSITALKEKYAGTIEIHLGMEVEYYPSQWETLKRWRKEMEYCILGQHCLSFHGFSSYDLTEAEQLDQYFDCLEEACRHGLCDYIAHPDVCLWSYPCLDESVRTLAEKIADLSLRYDMPLELNCGSGVRDYGWRHYEDGDRYAYPTRTMFEVFAEKKCPVIIGMDIHQPDHFLTDEYLNRALDIVKGLDLNYLNDFDLVSAAKKRKKNFF